MKLTVLGTGHATVTRCYNACFVLNDNGKYFLVDGGGGNRIFNQLEASGVDWREIRDIFVTHKHIDHLLGIIWLVRMICQSMGNGSYKGEARIYVHEKLAVLIKQMADMLLTKKQAAFIGKQLNLIIVENGQEWEIIGRKVIFFDIQSKKAKQFGFTMYGKNGRKFTYCGDEPYNPCEEKYVESSDWLVHEAFCLYSEADRFKPYEKSHSTVKDACELAESLHIKNLILFHTEEENLANRKKLYSEEGSAYFHGNLYIPDDLESFTVFE